jgi:hypothetical protein
MNCDGFALIHGLFAETHKERFCLDAPKLVRIGTVRVIPQIHPRWRERIARMPDDDVQLGHEMRGLTFELTPTTEVGGVRLG